MNEETFAAFSETNLKPHIDAIRAACKKEGVPFIIFVAAPPEGDDDSVGFGAYGILKIDASKYGEFGMLAQIAESMGMFQP